MAVATARIAALWALNSGAGRYMGGCGVRANLALSPPGTAVPSTATTESTWPPFRRVAMAPAVRPPVPLEAAGLGRSRDAELPFRCLGVAAPLPWRANRRLSSPSCLAGAVALPSRATGMQMGSVAASRTWCRRSCPLGAVGDKCLRYTDAGRLYIGGCGEPGGPVERPTVAGRLREGPGGGRRRVRTDTARLAAGGIHRIHRISREYTGNPWVSRGLGGPDGGGRA